MAAMSKAKLEFFCSATKAAVKKYPKWKGYVSLLKMASHEVMRTELPEITTMKLGIVLQIDKELLALNQNVLKHDFYTDILTFEIERNASNLEAELYFSLDRARENALHYKVSLRNELARLAIHGMLHLAGYDDKSPLAKKKMREKEQFYLLHLQNEQSIEY